MSASKKPASWLLLLIAWGMGIIALGLGAYQYWETAEAVQNGKYVEGTVIELVDTNAPLGQQLPAGKKPSSITASYVPRIRYQLAGITYRITGKDSSTFARYNVGDKVRIRYLEDRPDDGRIDSFTENWLGAIIALVLGTVLTLGASFGIWRRLGVVSPAPVPIASSKTPTAPAPPRRGRCT